MEGNGVFSIFEDKNGNLWFGTYGGGVSRYDGESFVTYTTAQGLAENNVWSIVKTDRVISGLAQTRAGYHDMMANPLLHLQPPRGWQIIRLITSPEDKTGNLWFCTAEGLSVMSADEAGKLPACAEATKIFKTFTKTDGLPDNFVTQVLQMPDGRMAAGTNLGITFFTPSRDLSTITGIEIYNYLTGCPVKDVNGGQNGMYLDSKGMIWVATGSMKTALVRLDPSALRTDNTPPTLVIQSIKVNEENICWNDLSQQSATHLPAGRSALINRKWKGEIGWHGYTANITEEVTTFGKILREAQRDSMWLAFR